MARAGADPPRTILIVDDDKVVLKILARIFQQRGYAIDVAGSGQEALAKIDGGRYAASIIDVRLGDMNGLDLLEPFKMVAPHTVKIMLTGLPSDDDRARALSCGASLYLSKPIKAGKLVETIDNLLNGQQV